MAKFFTAGAICAFAFLPLAQGEEILTPCQAQTKQALEAQVELKQALSSGDVNQIQAAEIRFGDRVVMMPQVCSENWHLLLDDALLRRPRIWSLIDPVGSAYAK
ncbi:MAG: hypothetical protein AB7G93_15705 [Bdellovibrionales bacterium]